MTGALAADTASQDLLDRYLSTRRTSMRLAAPLSPEDQLAQSMPDASPTKWHLAHTTWFFETFVLEPTGFQSYDPAFGYLFNSYYEALGARQPRPSRGLITRPSSAEVTAYREHVDAAMVELLSRGELDEQTRNILTLGFAHEEQHQELILMDVLHLFSQNALKPAYRRGAALEAASSAPSLGFCAFEGGLIEIGHAGEAFAFDNERPQHRVHLDPFELGDRLTTNSEWIAFINDGGYRRAEFWLSDGWAQVQEQRWDAPLYWSQQDGDWWTFGLRGEERVRPDAPVIHVSFYEADAFARWSGRRLPSEAEWEAAASGLEAAGVFLDTDHLAPRPASQGHGELRQMFGDVWEWTASPYSPYPGYRPAPGAVGEYNGKFMINQMVLRGGGCFTPQVHIRRTYRNFYHPHQRWQAAGVRLAG